MKKSKNPIPTENDKCIICRKPYAMTHEIMFGNPNAALSQQYGLTVRLCRLHHQDQKEGVHHNVSLDLKLKRQAQLMFQTNYPELDFCKVFQCKDYIALGKDAD